MHRRYNMCTCPFCGLNNLDRVEFDLHMEFCEAPMFPPFKKSTRTKTDCKNLEEAIQFASGNKDIGEIRCFIESVRDHECKGNAQRTQRISCNASFFSLYLLPLQDRIAALWLYS